MAYYWCTDHHSVEEDEGCRAEVRLGPFATRDAAEHALRTVAERNERFDREDAEWAD